MHRILYVAILLLASIEANQVHAQCTAGYSTNISSLQVQFTNQSTGSYNYIYYDFGDGNWSQQVNSPTYTYSSAGIYVACQTIYDTISFTCYDDFCDTLYLGGATCMANYYWWINTGSEVQFSENNLGTYTSMLWDFGDGSTSTVSTPSHTYANYGTYTVCLSLFDGSTLCDSVCYTVEVIENDCNADFTADINGMDVNFNNMSSGSYNAQYWDFGDGFGTSSDANPSYTYFVAGDYTVCLSVFDSVNGMCWDDYCETITVDGGGGGVCNADFTYDIDELYVELTNTSTGQFFVATWDYGDGNIGIDDFHTFDTPGTYDVCLTIIGFPCFDTECKTITVNEWNCEPGFTFTFDENNIFQFTNTTTVGNVTSVLWDFGDGNTSTFNNPQYYYNWPGTYEVCLTTYENGNVCGVVCQTVEVYPLGVAEQKSGAGFKVFPNPSDGPIHVALDGLWAVESMTISLLDLSGRVVFSQDFIGSDKLVTLNPVLASGTYLIHMGTSTGLNEYVRVVVK